MIGTTHQRSRSHRHSVYNDARTQHVCASRYTSQPNVTFTHEAPRARGSFDHAAGYICCDADRSKQRIFLLLTYAYDGFTSDTIHTKAKGLISYRWAFSMYRACARFYTVILSLFDHRRIDYI